MRNNYEQPNIIILKLNKINKKIFDDFVRYRLNRNT